MNRERPRHAGWVLPFVPTPFAALIFWWLGTQDLIASRPYWQYAALLLGCTVANLGALMLTVRFPSRARIHTRALVAAVSTTAVIYPTGWGSMIVIGYALGVADVIHSEGAAAWRPATVYSALGIVAGQVMISTGAAPTKLDGQVADAVALGNFICAAIVLRMFASSTDAARTAQRELQRQATTDPLTGLPNRAAITEALSTALERERTSVMFVDLDGFKAVNDRLGHERGDRVLVEAAQRIARSLVPVGHVGRLGGDEFLVVLPALPESQLVALADRVLGALDEPWPDDAALSASIGIATACTAETASELLARADVAMYHAKSAGRARWRNAG